MSDVAERIDKVVERCLAAIASGVPDHEERAYRRGYHHALNCCIAFMKAGGTVAELERWEQAVLRWRESCGAVR